MSRYGNLSHSEAESINSKLSELSKRTGQLWTYSVMDRRGAEKMPPLLEIVIDGQICRPITLPTPAQAPAKVICEVLESHAKARLEPASFRPSVKRSA
jgi:hypothetical protein